jgi:hypothetical protein
LLDIEATEQNRLDRISRVRFTFAKFEDEGADFIYPRRCWLSCTPGESMDSERQTP